MDYIKRVCEALQVSLGQSDLYKGKDGALRLAREVGSSLNDSKEEEANDYFNRSYNEVCVIGYGLKPPIDKREWDQEVMGKWERILKENNRFLNKNKQTKWFT